jgi:hypothetical protein
MPETVLPRELEERIDAFLRAGNLVVSDVRGDGGDDFVLAVGGWNAIYGGGGADTLIGGQGDDTFIYRGSSEAAAGEIVDGVAGTDTVLVVGSTTFNSTVASPSGRPCCTNQRKPSAVLGHCMGCTWQRLRTVGSSSWAAALAKINRVRPAGSSKVFSKVLAVMVFIRSAG